MKKLLMAIILICLLVAAVFYFTSSTGSRSKVNVLDVKALAEIQCYTYSSRVRIEKSKGHFWKSNIVCHYEGHVDVGIASPDSITVKYSEDGKSIHVSAPISILNENKWFIDGSPKYLDGDGFSKEEMIMIDKEGNDSIYQRFLNEGGVINAKNSMKEKLMDFLSKSGYETIDVDVTFVE